MGLGGRRGRRGRSSGRKSEIEMGKRRTGMNREKYLSIYKCMCQSLGGKEKGELVTELYISSLCI